MNACSTFSTPSLRFRRWTRARYAAFVSLHRAVTMGQLASHLADRFYKKQLSLHAGVGEDASAVEQYAEGKEEDGDVCAQEIFICQLIPLCGVAPVGDVAPALSVLFLVNNYYQGKNGECLYRALSVFFFIYKRYEC